MRRLATMVLLGALGCDPGNHTLVVDVRTDLTPGVEVDAFEVILDDGAPRRVPLPAGDLLAGARLAELGSVPPGDHVVRVRALLAEVVVVERPIAVELRDDRAITAVLARDCVDVDCTGDANLACLAGSCVDWACTPETPERCPTPACAADADCPARASCAEAACVAGACLYAELAGACGDGLACDPDAGCCDATGRCPDEAFLEGRWALAASADTLFLAFDVGGDGRVGGERYTTDTQPSDLFLQAREPDGETVRWTRRYATGEYEWPNDLAILSSGDVVLGGVAKDPSLFDADGVPLDVNGHDGLVAVLGGADGTPRWAQGLTVDDGENADVMAVAVGRDDAIFALVRFTSRLTVGTLTAEPVGLDTPGWAVVGFARADPTWTVGWVSTLHGEPEAIAVSDAGVWIVGWAETSVAVGTMMAAASDDGFAALLDPITGAPAWVRVYGGAAEVRLHDVAIDGAGLAHVVGRAGYGDGVFGAFTRTPAAMDVLLLGLDAMGEPAYAELAGGDGVDAGHRVVYSASSDSILWTATTDTPFEYSGGTVGDPDATVSLVACVSDTAGNPRGASTYAVGGSRAEWLPTWSIAITSALRGCSVGLAPADYRDAFFLGRLQAVHYSCGDL